jgi:glycosyltransferase involved in cell wall biosynthesis
MQQKKDEPMNDEIELSIVIPLFNEEESVEPLYAQLKEALEPLEQSYEIIIVDDGSTDRSFELLRGLQAQDKRLKVIRFRRNFGQTAAFAAGFEYARGQVVVTMDADLQNDPADIPRLLEKLLPQGLQERGGEEHQPLR